MSSSPDARTLHSWYVNLWRPSRVEESYEITALEGEIPRELNGTLYRNGPSQSVLPKEGHTALHLFDGDGLAHAFRFEDGRAFYTGAFVRHPTFLVEEKEGRYCMNGVSLKAENPVEVPPPGRVQPNTNIIHHAGRLFALVENGIPFELDARTLESLGAFNLEGKLLGYSTSAHPKVDGRTGQMILHGYSPVEPYVQLYVIEPDGSVSLAEVVDAPYATMMHDVAITEHHVIFPLCPVVWDASVTLSGGTFADALRWEPERGVKLGVRERRPGSPLRWFEAPTPGYFFHFGNAYEQDGKILFDACLYRDGQAFLDDLRTIRRGEMGPGLSAKPYLYELDLETGTCHDRQLDDRGAEFPRHDDRLTGYRNRFGYAGGEGFQSLIKYDRSGGPREAHEFGVGRWAGEPVFVPRGATAEEDDGFVLSVVYDGASDSSELVILDARGLAAAPLARLGLRHRIPMGFHGNFAPGIV